LGLGVRIDDALGAEGLALGPVEREAALVAALASILSLAASFRPALAA
jgi:hypothetical protein